MGRNKKTKKSKEIEQRQHTGELDVKHYQYSEKDLIAFIVVTSAVFYANSLLLEIFLEYNFEKFSTISKNLFEITPKPDKLKYESIKLTTALTIYSLAASVLCIAKVELIKVIIDKFKTKKPALNFKNHNKVAITLLVTILIYMIFTIFPSDILTHTNTAKFLLKDILFIPATILFVPAGFLIKFAPNTVIRYTAINAILLTLCSLVTINIIKKIY
ncbi:hypothetical protein [Maridesulfovibrio salexigens]|uniref:Uncharacterized protein n=1 Tax=Maridesulfovibrio salexigens (strain ATCC 14822 / DSM 2638 / NCIMB 8403 / VKM B-1763) TaxID=526222 RepID=C6BTQ7_MARSD|nr:hypothetical protein [Maridesulfovibrio salexigens]ACS79837.1 hypothetical protein Desal_1775 [Maridesulfovibrio salexigens DSM 2638]